MHPEALSPVDELAIKQAGAADRATLLARRREAHQLDDFLASRKLSDAVFGCLRGEERVFGFLLVGDRVGDLGRSPRTTSPCSRRSRAMRVC